MFGDFIFLMSHANVRNLGHHAYGGIALFVLFVIHHILNIWFYKTQAKGKYNRHRIMVSVTAYLLLVLMILMAVSAVFASSTVFETSPFIFSQGFRTLHLMSTSWGYMVMSFHVALHVHSPLNKLDKNLEMRFARATSNSGDKNKHRRLGKILSLIFYVVLIAVGIFSFWKIQLYVYLFNIGNWKMAAPNLPISCLAYTAITAAVCAGYHLMRSGGTSGVREN